MKCETVYDEFARRFSQFGHVMLAGGSVRDQLLGRAPKDFDVFVSGEFKPADAIAVCEDLKPIDVYPGHAYEPFMRGQWYWHGVEVQVMATSQKNLTDLIGRFDWSCSLFGYDGSWHRGADIDHITKGGELYLNYLTYPESTLSRGFRFVNKFGMKIRRADLLTICSQIVERSKA
jgi:hypothetical protein